MSKISSRFRNIIRIQGSMFLILSASMLAPLFMALHYGEDEARQAFAAVIAGCMLCGIIIRFCCSPSRAKKLKLRDGFLVVSLTCFLCSFIGALPFCLSGAIPSMVDAFFESCSGFSTTGATILTDIEALPRSLLFWRSFTHWLGGMGIVVFVITLLPVLGISGQIAANAKTPGSTKDKITAHISDMTKSLYALYILFTLAEVALLKLGGMTLFDSFIHSFGTISTGGFSNYNDSIAHFDSIYIKFVILFFMLLAGINFNLFFLAKRRGIRSIFKDEEARFYFTVIGTASLLVFAANQVFAHFKSPLNSLLDSVFQVVSIMTTTGYTTADYDIWPTFSRMIIFCLFFFGGCSSSTSGGIKCVRTLVCIKLVRRSISLRLHPNRIVPLTLNDAELPTEVIIRITNFMFTYVVVIFTGTLLLSVDNLDFVSSLSAAATCVGNIGPGFNLLGPACNFAILSDFSTLVCSFLMLAGRLEIITVLALFSKYYWNPNKAK